MRQPPDVLIPSSAIVHVPIGPRFAAFTWRTPDGIAWLEDGYLDPYGAPRNQFHRVSGRVEAIADGYSVTSEDAVVRLFAQPLVADDPTRCPPEWQRQHAVLERMLADQHTTWAEEAVRISRMLAGELRRTAD